MNDVDVDDADDLAKDFASPADWSAAAVRLMQGVVYHESNDVWEAILANVSPLSDFFARLAIVLVVDESEGMAYLRQLSDDEMTPEHERVPKLFRRTKLGYEATLLCVLLRDELRRFEEEDVQNERCVVLESDLLDAWRAFFPGIEDEVRMGKQLHATLKKIESLRFVKLFEKQPPSWEIRRILKARLPVEELESLRRDLLEAVQAKEAPTEERLTDFANQEFEKLDVGQDFKGGGNLE